MPKPDWYSRIMLTALVALLLVVAAELRLSNQLSLAARRAGEPATPQYAPRPVAFRPASAPPDVQEVRIVGYRYEQGGSNRIYDFGTGYDQAPGLPVAPIK